VVTVKFSGDEAIIHRDEKGILRENFSNRRVIIFSCSAYRSMCDALYEQFQSGAGIILYRMGEGYGSKLVRGLSGLDLSEEEKIQAFEKLAHLAGWGKLAIKVDEDKKSGEVIVEESPFTLRRHDIGPISCHFMAGVLAGGASELFGTEYKAQELRCAAKDGGVCRFRIYQRTSE
jgi:predicted hydrocarbon binding protein